MAKKIGIEILFKVNNRPYGLIRPQAKKRVMEILKNGR
jgi:hypothetical protein